MLRTKLLGVELAPPMRVNTEPPPVVPGAALGARPACPTPGGLCAKPVGASKMLRYPPPMPPAALVGEA